MGTIILVVIFFIIAAVLNKLQSLGSRMNDEWENWEDFKSNLPVPPRTRQQTPPPVQSKSPRPLPLPRSLATSDWEAELRRMLEGNQPAPPPPARSPAPAPPPLPPPVPVQSWEPETTVPPPIYRPPPTPVIIAPVPAMPPRHKREFGALHESTAAHQRVEMLDDLVSQRLTQVSAAHQHFYKTKCKHCAGGIEFPATSAGTRVECPHCGEHVLLVIQETAGHLTTGVALRPTASESALAALKLVRNPQTISQAMIASIILGPPKALSADNRL